MLRNLKTYKKKKKVNEFSKVAGCKINIQKSVILLHTSSEQSENEIKGEIPFKSMKKLST